MPPPPPLLRTPQPTPTVDNEEPPNWAPPGPGKCFWPLWTGAPLPPDPRRGVWDSGADLCLRVVPPHGGGGGLGRWVCGLWVGGSVWFGAIWPKVPTPPPLGGVKGLGGGTCA